MEEIVTESDVEQKFLQPLLTKKRPYGLGFEFHEFLTKENIRKFEIDKGINKKVYFPDYIIVLQGFPLVVIEAKKPGEDLNEAYREARLYASELNAIYQTGINPCQYVVASNYDETVMGNWDCENPEITFTNSNITAANKNYYDFIDKINKESLLIYAKTLLKNTRGNNRFLKPVFLFSGRAFQSDLIGDNGFGTNLALDYQHIYNPETEEERKNVVINAYINSKKRESHVSPIEKIIKRSGCSSSNDLIDITDTGNPEEVINTLKEIDHYKKAVCILIGSVGAGKSTFIDYLRFQALDKELVNRTAWLTLNMNNAPEDSHLIYDWVFDNLIDIIKSSHGQEDISSLENIMKIFKEQIKIFDKGPVKLLPENERSKELYNFLIKLQNDKNKYLNSLIKYFYVNKNIIPIVVCDNCDKRSRDIQLLMFDVANWIKTNFDCMVFLPLRDTTYDQYRKTPPLDTAIKDLTFRIDPPLLDRVLQARYEYILREFSNNSKDFFYTLSNGMRVQCKREDVGNYLKSILTSIFQNDLTKRIFIGLAGRDVRKGVEIFLEFCKSGYITDDMILRIRTSNGLEKIPTNVAMQILIKGTRRFYNDTTSRLKNIFFSDKEDYLPDPFVRLAILQWLKKHYDEKGPKELRSYHSINSIIADLSLLGHNEDRIKKEIEYLIMSDLIITESQIKRFPEENELISITSTGFIHLDLMQNIYYLAFISEDTYFDSEKIAQRIADNLIRKRANLFLDYPIILENAKDLVDYLADYYHKANFKIENFNGNGFIENYCNIDDLRKWIQKKADETEDFIDYNKLIKDYPCDYKGYATVARVVGSSYIVKIGEKCYGYLEGTGDTWNEGDTLFVCIKYFDSEHNKFVVTLANENP
ncbi:MAG: type I restriction enzyme HsdR N-terminal domain-containing protein [Treponema sp.]|nr:type I restriction enzyme HsdR N-terminal domain-containing protein [Treponema sp.]